MESQLNSILLSANVHSDLLTSLTKLFDSLDESARPALANQLPQILHVRIPKDKGIILGYLELADRLLGTISDPQYFMLLSHVFALVPPVSLSDPASQASNLILKAMKGLESRLRGTMPEFVWTTVPRLAVDKCSQCISGHFAFGSGPVPFPRVFVDVPAGLLRVGRLREADFYFLGDSADVRRWAGLFCLLLELRKELAGSRAGDLVGSVLYQQFVSFTVEILARIDPKYFQTPEIFEWINSVTLQVGTYVDETGTKASEFAKTVRRKYVHRYKKHEPFMLVFRKQSKSLQTLRTFDQIFSELAVDAAASVSISKDDSHSFHPFTSSPPAAKSFAAPEAGRETATDLSTGGLNAKTNKKKKKKPEEETKKEACAMGIGNSENCQYKVDNPLTNRITTFVNNFI